MKLHLYPLLAVLLAATGCASASNQMRFAVQRWARSVHARNLYPAVDMRLEPIGPRETLAIRATFPDADHGTLDFGDGLILNVLSPENEGRWAQVALEDADQDGVRDVRFSAVLLPERQPVTAFFLRRKGAWEKYLVPVDFNLPVDPASNQ